MNISLSSSPFSGLKTQDTLVVLCTEETRSGDPAFLELDHAHDGAISASMEREKFKAKWKNSHVFRPGDPGPGLLITVGTGESLLPISLLLKQAGGLAVERARGMGSDHLVVSWLGDLPENVSRFEVTRLLAEGMLLAEHQQYSLKKKDDSAPSMDALIAWPGQDTLVLTPALARAALVARGMNVARDLVDEPAKTMTPTALAERILNFASARIIVDCHGPEWLKDKGMNGILGVSAGSSAEPRLIEVEYDPKDGDSKAGELLLVGKGITFDSGGLSLKPGDSMKTMKSDMAGAAALAGLCSILDELSPMRPVRLLIPACENMPGCSAIKLGDILHIHGGKTVEVLNTDAEGRLLLADALAYGAGFKPKAAIDIATLTGASVVALGRLYATVMGSSGELVRDILSSSERAGEPIWELPLIPFYRKQLESKIADLKNVGQRWGGAITAGLFLSEFIDPIPWAHVDIAGPAWTEKAEPAFPEGGSGFGVATLVDLLMPERG